MIERVIGWLNENHGFSMSTLTLTYVLATVIICYFSMRAEKATKNQTEEIKKQFDETNRPYIEVDFICIENLCGLNIENIGTRPATNIKVAVNEEFVEENKKLWAETSLKYINSIDIQLGVGKKWFCAICRLEETSKFNKILKITTNYEYENRTFEEYSEINLSHYEGLSPLHLVKNKTYDTKGVENSLAKISKSLEKISKLEQ